MQKIMDHNAYPKSLHSKSKEALRFIMKDAHQASQAFLNGPNVGYYLDEINYCGMELARRAKQ